MPTFYYSVFYQYLITRKHIEKDNSAYVEFLVWVPPMPCV